ncbi:MAG: hypothetical protein HYZ74_00850 [Elusimicrobia bacterium]|nr:hypothetical protein [Elusimicrobiota bacterium]
MILSLLLALAGASASAESSVPVAGSVVRSKEWVIRRGASKEEEFIGEVRYASAGNRLSSDWALFKHQDRSWRARGNVLLRRRLEDGTEIEARGETAGHDEDTKRGYLDPAPGGRVSFRRSPPEGVPDHGHSGRVAWDGDRRVTFSAGARVWGPRLELAADEAVYENATGRLTLNGGRPVLRKIEGEWTTALKADEVVATEAPRRIEARGKVKGWMIFRDPEKLKDLAK